MNWRCAGCAHIIPLVDEDAKIRAFMHRCKGPPSPPPTFTDISPTDVHRIIGTNWQTMNVRHDEDLIARCEWAMEQTHGNIREAAQLLGISRYTLYRWLRRRKEPGYERQSGKGKHVSRAVENGNH